MAGKTRHRNPVPVGDLVSGIVDPVLARRAGMTTGLIGAWDAIVGDGLARSSRPEGIRWPRRTTSEEPFRPATLVVACEGWAALHVQHQTGEIIARVNAFMGFAAIDRVRIVQKSVLPPSCPVRMPARQLSRAERDRIAATVAPIDDEGLRAALERLGRSVALRASR